MEVRAVAKFVRVQPRKVRLVANEVKGKPAIMAANLLRFHPSKGAFVLRKVLISAIFNAENTHGLDSSMLKIREIRVDEGPVLKRIQARAMGRANRIHKRMSHITVVVDEMEPVVAAKVATTPEKPRPKLAVAAKKGKKAAAPVAEVEELKEEVVTEEVVAEEVAEVTEEVAATEVKAPEAEGEEKN